MFDREEVPSAGAYDPKLACESRRITTQRLAALKSSRTAIPIMARSSSIWADTIRRRVAPRCDVAEAHRREDGDREVERPDVVERLGEGPRRLVRHGAVDA